MLSLAGWEGNSMEKAYWIGRKRAAMAMAREASGAEERLAHYELAGLYSIKAAHCPPFLLAQTASSANARRPVLHLPGWGSVPPGPIFTEQPPAEAGLSAKPRAE